MAENGLLDKLSNQLVDSNKIPYVQMNKPKKAYWSTLDKALFWSVPLLIFIGIAALFLLVTQQEYFVRYNPLVQQTGENEGDSPLKWNELVFTQLWGYSSCLQFKDKRASSDVSCRYEDRASFWSIHGIWPSKAGTEGPSFCSRVQFNISQLDPIRSSLDEYWYEIDSTKQGNYFWSHEWKKHGSCAKQLNTFETELKYFNAGLELRTKFDLFTALKNGGNIIPEKPADAEGYDVDKIEQSIKTALGTSATPYIQCLRKKGSSDSNDDADYYLLAVELCLTTDLQLIDCTHKKRLTSNLKDNALPCPKNTPIKYLDNTL